VDADLDTVVTALYVKIDDVLVEDCWSWPPSCTPPGSPARSGWATSSP